MELPRKEVTNRWRLSFSARSYGLLDTSESTIESLLLEIKPILQCKALKQILESTTLSEVYRNHNLPDEATIAINHYYTLRYKDIYFRDFLKNDEHSFNELVSYVTGEKTAMILNLPFMDIPQKHKIYVNPDGLTKPQIKAILGELDSKITKDEANGINELYLQSIDTFITMRQRTEILTDYVIKFGLAINDSELVTQVRKYAGYGKGDSWILNSGELNQFISKAEKYDCTETMQLVKIEHEPGCTSKAVLDEDQPLTINGTIITQCDPTEFESETLLTIGDDSIIQIRTTEREILKTQKLYDLEIDSETLKSIHSKEHPQKDAPKKLKLRLRTGCKYSITPRRDKCLIRTSKVNSNWKAESDITIWYGYLKSLTMFDNRYSKFMPEHDFKRLSELENILTACLTAYEDGYISATTANKSTH